MRHTFLLLAVLNVLCCSKVGYATCSGKCYDLYCGPNGSHGYCTDYIQYRRGIKQPKDAKFWHGGIYRNGVRVGEVDRNDVHIGDVAIFVNESYGHVAVVEGVDGNNITISEWNFGGCSTSTCDLECGVTDDYNKTETRSVSISSVTRFWRPEDRIINNPDGGITYYHGEHTHLIQHSYRCSNNFCWEGDGNNWDLNCYDAHTWYEVSGSVYHNRTDSSHRTMRDRSMCASVYHVQPGMGSGFYTPPNGNYTLTPENGYGNTPQTESYLDPNHKHAISMDDTEISVRGQEW